MFKCLKGVVASTIAGILLMSPVAHAKDPIRRIEGVVINVSDGDTIKVQDDLGTTVKVRLYGIDAPETEKSNKKTGHISKRGQTYGEEAYQALRAKVFRKIVKIDIMDIDKYKRSVGIVWLNGNNVNQELVAEGYSWAYRKYLDRPHASEYIELEDQARSKQLGLWRQNNPQPPWEFRKMQKESNY